MQAFFSRVTCCTKTELKNRSLSCINIKILIRITKVRFSARRKVPSKYSVVVNKVQNKNIQWCQNSLIFAGYPQNTYSNKNYLSCLDCVWDAFNLRNYILLRICFCSLLKKKIVGEFKCLWTCTALLFRYNFHTILM